jgi:hypothetical protein
MQHEIERSSMPSAPDFVERYVHKRHPVVITGLFAGQEVDSVRSVDDAARTWGSVHLQVQEEYASAEGARQDPVAMSLREYVALSRSNPETRLCCTEYDTPARVLASFRLPAVCELATSATDEVFDLPKKYGDLDLMTNTFVANAGNVAHLHFDGDQREVLLHQVYGRKRILLFPPSAATHLQTLDGPFSRPSLAGVYPERMSHDEQRDLVEHAGGWETVLEPGETIYIPMLMWHHVEYLDDAMSFNLRFGRTPYGRFLSLDHFHRDPYIQNVASTMVGDDDQLRGFGPVIEEIKATYERPARDARDKVRQVRARFRDLCARFCPDADAEHLCPPEREDEQISRIVASKDMAGGLKYADPAVIARARPVGPISGRQSEIIRDNATARGWSEEVQQAVLRNRFGKADVGDLTKAEAAQLLIYLGTPGATW